MSRIRTVKPELFRHEELFDAELETGLPLRLAFIGLFTVSDCEGRFHWKPRTLKLDVLPHDIIDFVEVLNALEHHGFIQSYAVDGVKYGWIPSFTKHQRLQTKEMDAGSSIPAYSPEYGTKPEHPPVRTGCVPEHPPVRTGTHPEAQEGKGREEEGKGRDSAAQAPCASPPMPPTPPMPEPEPEPAAAKPEPAPAPKAARQPKPIKRRIAPDWTPADSTLALLERSGICRDYAERCVEEFRLYWQERGESRPGWEASFVNNVKRQWERRPPPTPPTPTRNGARYEQPPPQRQMTPEVAEFDAILRGLNVTNARPVIEGECYATH